jgi:hypothetical protein
MDNVKTSTNATKEHTPATPPPNYAKTPTEASIATANLDLSEKATNKPAAASVPRDTRKRTVNVSTSTNATTILTTAMTTKFVPTQTQASFATKTVQPVLL